MTGMFATLFYIPLFLQSALGYGALQAGLVILPQALVMGFLTPISGRLYDKIGPRWLVFFGLLISAFGSYLLTGINPDVTQERDRRLDLHPLGRGRAVDDGDHDRRHLRAAERADHQRQRDQHRRAAGQRRAGPGRVDRAGDHPAGAAGRRPDRRRCRRRWDAHALHRAVRGLPAASTSTVFAQSLSNVFLVTTATTLIAAFIGLSLRSGPQHHDDDAPVMIE